MNTLNTKGELEELKDGVLYFTAPWCAPCKMFSPIIEDVSSEHGNISFYKIDVDQFDDLCGAFGIRNVPTLIFFKNGELQDKTVGSKYNKETLTEKINEIYYGD